MGPPNSQATFFQEHQWMPPNGWKKKKNTEMPR